MFRLRLKSPTMLPLEFAQMTPDGLMGKPIGKVQRMQVWHGRDQVPLGELFDITTDDAENRLLFEGDLPGSVGLGGGMTSGLILVEGNAGHDVGLGMWGGEIEVRGDAGDGLGMEMRGGVIRVRGSAGDGAGSAQIGSVRGMTGGTIVVNQDAGIGVGRGMRRGLIAIAGRAGDLIGHRMLAGTIVVGGPCVSHVGVGMSRGTICLLNGSEHCLLPTFRYACLRHVSMLGLVGRALQSLGLENDVWNANRRWKQFAGDFLVSGRGEVFLADN